MRRNIGIRPILTWEKWVGRGWGKIDDAFSSLPKPLPSLNPRWRSLDQKCTRSRPRQNMPALQARRRYQWYYVSCFIHSRNLTSIYMLFAGWEARIVKSCDRGLENAAQGRRPRAAFSSPRSQFFTIRTDPKPANNLFIFFLL